MNDNYDSTCIKNDVCGGKAMTDREAEYRKETGDNPFNTDAWFNSKFISWLIQKLDKAEAERDELVGVLKAINQIKEGEK